MHLLARSVELLFCFVGT